jgi:hypothetical protein
MSDVALNMLATFAPWFTTCSQHLHPDSQYTRNICSLNFETDGCRLIRFPSGGHESVRCWRPELEKKVVRIISASDPI